MGKQTSLVCQHLENVSREVLEKYQDIVRQYIRRRNGIYALFRRGKLYYVGLASSLSRRLKQHLKDKHRHLWDCFSVYLTIGDTHMKELESLVMRIAKPIGNQQTGKLCGCEDLRKRLARDIKARELRRVKGMFDLAVAAEHHSPKKKGATKEDGRAPVLAEYVSRPMRLRAVFKGKTVKAKVGRNGMIRFRGKQYTSPSRAGAAAMGRPTCNGWTFWQYERAPGDWVLLDELRR